MRRTTSRPRPEPGALLHPALRARPSVLLRWVARRAEAAVTAELAEQALHRSEFRLLVVLNETPSRGGLTVQALVERAAVDRAAIVEALNELEDQGLVTRSADPMDRRTRLAAITQVGREVIADAVERVAEAEARALRPLNARERERVRVLLERTLPPPRRTVWDYLR